MPCPMCGEPIARTAIRCRYCGEDLALGGFHAASYVVYAGFWSRVAASILDGLVLVVPTVIISFAIGFAIEASGLPMDVAEICVVVAPNVASAVLQWLYAALLESSEKQATLGKMAVGIKVTDLDGRRLTFARASGRHFGKILSMGACWIGFIMVGFTPRKQGLHDMLASCLVVRK